jgi:hypothetical protein
MTALATSQPRARWNVHSLTGVIRREQALFRASVAVVALHVADDNFLQPNRGTSAVDHLFSGLVPLALLAAAAVTYGRARPGVRAALALSSASSAC